MMKVPNCFAPLTGGKMGCVPIATPNMNRLAAQGMRFTDGHSSSGV